MLVTRDLAPDATAAPETAAAAEDRARFDGGRVGTIAASHGIHDSYTAFLAPMLIIFRQTMGISNTQAEIGRAHV